MNNHAIAIILIPVLLVLLYYFLRLSLRTLAEIIRVLKRGNNKDESDFFFLTKISDPYENGIDYRYGASPSDWAGLQIVLLFFLSFFILDFIIENLR